MLQGVSSLPTLCLFPGALLRPEEGAYDRLRSPHVAALSTFYTTLCLTVGHLARTLGGKGFALALFLAPA
jgi:hypothetical protein